MKKSKTDDFLEDAIETARKHGDESGADYEVGDLQELARLLWGHLGPQSRQIVAAQWDPLGEKEGTPSADVWERLPDFKIPPCDLCPKAATHRSHTGRLRCATCPKPKER